MTQTWTDILKRYGLASLIAVYLLWWATDGLAMKVDRLVLMMHTHVTESNFYLRALCLNSAQNETQRASCIPPSERR